MSTTAGSIVIDLLARTGSFETDIDRANKKLKSVGKQSTETSEMMKLLSNAATSVGGLIAGAFSVRAIVDYADAYTELENRLKLVTNSSMQLAGATNAVFSIAMKTNQSLDSTAQVYQRFAQNAATLGLNQQKVAEVTETVSKAVAVSGASTSAAEAALTQFGQALASGVFRGDEFNSVMEQTPALAQAIAKGLGVTVGELRNMAAQGKLTGSVLIEALSKSKDYVDQQFNTRVVTVGQSFENLQTSITGFIGQANTAFGGSSIIVHGIDTVSAAIGRASDSMVHDGNSVSAAWELVSDRIDKLNQAAERLGENYAGVTSAMGDGTTELTTLISSSFADSFRSTLQDLDNVSLLFNKTVAWWGGLFKGVTQGIEIYFANMWDRVLNGTSNSINNISASISTVLGKFGIKPLGMVSFGGPGKRDVPNPVDVANRAYQSATGTNLVGEYDRRLGLKGLNNAFDIDLRDLGGGPSSGVPASSKTGKAKRSYIADDLDEYLTRIGELPEWLEEFPMKADKSFDQVSQFAVQASRNIQSSLGDGLYNILKGNFSDIGQSFGDMVLRMVANAEAANISQALFGDYGKSGSIGGLIGNFISNFVPSAGQLPANVVAGPYLNSSLGTTLDVGGFASGGYTGSGGQFDPAGVVHKDEFVFNRESTRRIGVGNLYRMMRGYSDGGLVGASPLSGSRGAAAAPNVQLTVINQSSQPVQASASPARFNGERWVQTVVLTDLRKNGPIAQQLKALGSA